MNLKFVLFVHSWHSFFHLNYSLRLHFDSAQWREPKSEEGEFTLELTILLALELELKNRLALPT